MSEPESFSDDELQLLDLAMAALESIYDKVQRRGALRGEDPSFRDALPGLRDKAQRMKRPR